MKSLSDYLSESIDSKPSQETPIPARCGHMSVIQIADEIHYKIMSDMVKNNAAQNDYYVGICKNVESNMQRHNNDSYIALVDCESREKAGQVETELGNRGFDVGDRANNGGDEQTTIVYAIYKDASFK